MFPGDPGLQPERTRLAWQRTRLLMLVLAVLVIKTTFSLESALRYGVIASLLGCTLVSGGLLRHLSARLHGAYPIPVSLIKGCALSVVLVALLLALDILTRPV